ncbi:MAG: hypothetical protein AAF485_31945 [Chloroflexota bacterium]
MTANADVSSTHPDPQIQVPQPEIPSEESQVYVAGQWQLMWWRFRKHKLAMFSALVTILIYMVALFAEFLAPFPADLYKSDFTYAPPQTLRFFQTTEEGRVFNLYFISINVRVEHPTLFGCLKES